MDFGANSRIDLRGERAEEAIRQVDDLISNALISNVDTLTIIHGKGTGALRAAIHEWLSAHPSVQSFRLGELVEGGSGVTIVQL
jgi:DNA mismatch repair protein MutS2